MSDVSLSEIFVQLSPGTIVAIAILVVVNYALLAWAIVRVVKTPAERVRYGSKAVWILVALLLNGIGPIITLALATLPPRVGESVSALSLGANEVADMLYPGSSEKGGSDE